MAEFFVYVRHNAHFERLTYGPLAHLVERYICNVEVAGPSPARSTPPGIRELVIDSKNKLL
ncbi:MAG: hypothetical protein UV28_C0007G0002 [Candidatus Collierbacteria bacterium GW2011_GWE2_42_48]|nr:MAG: hypothetical protein UU94_C0009G0003 [Candidatus Collierbacteria bacterium GW2011_GWB2_42_12]KKS62041.1 MAG: hypothetical protein UV30_C0025G0004 [Candidatus Collierbacteria bacterium GW2011_GWF1_42_50]KKS62600.1 MAG: hypothetical protein UV29_C0013G0004 [Candidatus Collierbacteria bacterium GW2011_GWD2_42_50]KKS62632.1 MAG: hypothetical protein UV28_C0007G0002 [Candidatus Collierbacteria bacterium GW2011_GWE2_42_48]